MIVLDTNVVSETLKAVPDQRVLRWLAAQPSSSLFLSTVTVAEIEYGVEVLASGARKYQLRLLADSVVSEFSGRLLPFDEDAAREYGVLAAQRRRSGIPISQFDAQIAAIVRSRGARLATRNLRDFVDCGIQLIDPWSG